jgi:predicted cation transporter
MLFQPLSELCYVALVATALSMPLLGAFVHRRGLWFDSKLASAIQDIPLNVVLTMNIVVLGLLATIITPILPLFALGAIAFFLPIDRRTKAKFSMMGGFSIALGALTTLDLPYSIITTMRLDGSPFTTTALEIVDIVAILFIAATGILGLFFLKADCKSSINSI